MMVGWLVWWFFFPIGNPAAAGSELTAGQLTSYFFHATFLGALVPMGFESQPFLQIL